MIYLPSFIKIGSAIQKSIVGDTYKDTQTTRSFTSLHFVFQNKERRLKIVMVDW
jgi:hypothetical protein